MKYAILIAALYEIGIGAGELLWVTTGSTSLASVAALPSVASLFDSTITGSSQSANANEIEGGIDLAIGGALLFWYFRA